MMYLDEVSVGLSSISGVEFTASNIFGNDVSLLVDMANSDDLTLSSVEVSGENFVKSNDASSTKISDVEFLINSGQTPVLEQSCVGVCIVENVTINDSCEAFHLSATAIIFLLIRQ